MVDKLILTGALFVMISFIVFFISAMAESDRGYYLAKIFVIFGAVLIVASLILEIWI